MWHGLNEKAAGCLPEYSLKDPRIKRKKLHALSDILFITLCGVICGAESWRDIEDYAHQQEEFLRRYIALENGIPSKSTVARVFSLLDPEGFKQPCSTCCH